MSAPSETCETDGGVLLDRNASSTSRTEGSARRATALNECLAQLEIDYNNAAQSRGSSGSFTDSVDIVQEASQPVLSNTWQAFNPWSKVPNTEVAFSADLGVYKCPFPGC